MKPKEGPAATPVDADDEQRRYKSGHELVVLFAALFRAIHMYDRANETITSHSERICRACSPILEADNEVEVTVRHDSVFVNAQRIRESSVGVASCRQVIDLLRAARLGAFTLEDEVTPSDVELFVRLLQETAHEQRSPEELTRELSIRGITHISVQPIKESEELAEELTPEQTAKRIYMRSIDAVRNVFHELRTVDRISARRVKRVVQGMIDSMENNPGVLINLATLKNYDEYSFNHSVNVSVLAIALGRHVHLTRLQLYTLGQAGMLHDLGKLCIPKEILVKPGRLTPEERRVMEAHTVEGFVSVARKLGVSAETIDIALTAFEHHMNLDGTGYPRSTANRSKGLVSRIVSIVDRYDAMTTDRPYRTAISPQKALAILFHVQRQDHDYGLLKYFMNLLGYYPLGTTARLSDGSVAIVIAGAARPELRHLPKVRLILDPEGKSAKGETVDLARAAEDGHMLHIAETVNPKDYGIEVMDYILPSV